MTYYGVIGGLAMGWGLLDRLFGKIRAFHHSRRLRDPRYSMIYSIRHSIKRIL